MNLNNLAKEAYAIAKAHGWHNEERSKEHYLMLIITEVAEAVQADRKKKHADVAKFKEWQGNSLPLSEETMERRFKEDFESYIKNTVEDELADIIIRCLDLAGTIGLTLEDTDPIEKFSEDPSESFAEGFYWVCATLANPFDALNDRLSSVIHSVREYSAEKGIEIEWFVEQKMKYNRLRPYKHGGLKY